MKGTRFFRISIALVACVLALFLAAEAGFVSVAWAKGKPPSGEQLPWGVDRIDADLAWSTTKGSGIKVAVVDTGIDIGHPDLVTSRGINFVGAVYPGDGNYDDSHGHGTAIAGVIAAIDNEIGVIGVGPEIELWAVKVREQAGTLYPDNYPDHGGTYNFTDLCEGMRWCLDNGIQVINFSLGTWTIKDGQRLHPLHDCEFYSYIKEAATRGIVMLGAAGNQTRRIQKFDNPPLTSDYEDTSDIYDFPASYPEVIAVSATGMKKTGKPSERGDYPASWTNYGPAIELSAPGVSIYTTTINGGYSNWSGTSLAAPHVVGTAASLLAIGVPAGAVRERLRTTAEDLGATGLDEYYGYGLVDAGNAVAGLLAPPRYTTSLKGKLSVTWGKIKTK